VSEEEDNFDIEVKEQDHLQLLGGEEPMLESFALDVDAEPDLVGGDVSDAHLEIIGVSIPTTGAAAQLQVQSQVS